MPQLTAKFNAYPVSVVLDANGNGAILFQAVGNNVRITNRSVKVSSATKQAIATTYRGQISDNSRIDGTNSGSTGDSNPNIIELTDGETIYIQWTGGDAGATATATFTGITLPFDQMGATSTGAGWSNPIAAGDGTLIYPALKSPNYTTGVAGWNLDRTGNVEFNSAVIRGEVLAGGGTVRLNLNGVKVDGTSQQYDMNKTAGFLARPIPDDGARVQITTTSLSQNAGVVYVSPTDPSSNGNAMSDGHMLGANDITLAPGFDYPYIWLRSPSVTGLVSGDLRLYGQTSDSPGTINSNAVFDTTRLTVQSSSGPASTLSVDGNDMGRGWHTGTDSIAVGAAIGATETVVLTCPVKDFKPGRLYKIVVTGPIVASVANNTPLFRIRKTNTAGQQFDAFRVACISTAAHPLMYTAYFRVGAATVNASIVLTLTGSGAFNATLSPSATSPATMNIYDDGLGSSRPNMPVLV